MYYQNGYSESFKISVVQEVESGLHTHATASRYYGIKGHSTILRWIRKYGSEENYKAVRRRRMSEIDKEQLLLENEIKALKKQLDHERLRNVVLETMVDIADKELGTDIRKKYGSKHAKK